MDNNKDIYSSPMAIVEQFFFCGVPFRLDSYSGCSHDCLYCFARAIELGHSNKNGSRDKILPADINYIKRQFNKSFNTDKSFADIEVEWLRRRVPIHWGGMSDPFQPIEHQYKISLSILDTLNKYNYPCVISTKGRIIIEPEYLTRIKQGLYATQISLITDDDDLISKIEPHAPSATERLNIIETLANNNIWVACRIQPMIPVDRIENNIDNFVTKLANVGVKHIVVEAYKPPLWNKEWKDKLDKIFDYKISHEFKVVGSEQVGMELILPSWRKYKYLKQIIDVAHKYNITVGAADNDLRDIGDTECCCGIDKLEGFGNYWKYQTGRIANIAKCNGICKLSDIADEWTGKCKFNFNKQGLTMEGNVRVRESVKYYVDKAWKWGDQRSPACMVNLKQIYKDGEVVYVYKNKLEDIDKLERRQQSLF